MWQPCFECPSGIQMSSTQVLLSWALVQTINRSRKIGGQLLYDYTIQGYKQYIYYLTRLTWYNRRCPPTFRERVILPDWTAGIKLTLFPNLEKVPSDPFFKDFVQLCFILFYQYYIEENLGNSSVLHHFQNIHLSDELK